MHVSHLVILIILPLHTYHDYVWRSVMVYCDLLIHDISKQLLAAQARRMRHLRALLVQLAVPNRMVDLAVLADPMASTVAIAGRGHHIVTLWRVFQRCLLEWVAAILEVPKAFSAFYCVCTYSF